MKKTIITILVIIFLVGGGIGLGIFVIKRNNTATSILVVSFNSQEIILSNPNVIQDNNSASQITNINKQDNVKSAQFILNNQNKIISIYSLNKEEIFFQKIKAEGKSITEVVKQLTLNVINDNIYKIDDNIFFNFELYSNNFDNAESLKNKIINNVNEVLSENKIIVDIKTKLYLQTSNIIEKYSKIARETNIDLLNLQTKTEFDILQYIKEQLKYK